MTLLHWNYFLALEDDLEILFRYIEFHKDNLKTYSIETARILMLATQEVDVLLKQLCKKHGNSSGDEAGYRQFFPQKYSRSIGVPLSKQGRQRKLGRAMGCSFIFAISIVIPAIMVVVLT